MQLGRWNKRTLVTLWWHDIDEVNIQRQIAVVRQWECGCKFTLMATKTTMLTTQNNTKAVVGLSKTITSAKK